MNIKDINQMSDDIFIDYFKNIFEKTPLLAKLASSNKPFKDKKNLINIFMNSFENLDKISKKNIIKNHPDLGSKLKIENNLTTLSSNEQEKVGLNKCTPEEYDFFHKMNDEFKLKFDIPFIFAVKGSNKNIIIEEFKRRLLNDDVNKEFEESVKQVKKIALFRLEDSIDD